MKVRWASGHQIGGKYTLVQIVGRGGMSEVWSARNEMTGANVALKLLHNAGTDSDLIARFKHEAMVGAQLDHRNIARVYDFLCEPDGTLALVMALLRGKSVEERLQECVRMPQREAVAVALGALAGLELAHESGILHCDIKPGNVFLSVDSDGLVTPKLLDFGIAKLPEGGVHTRDGTFLGTPQYMAPERVRDTANVGARSDLFSIGVLLFEMLSGKSPFERPSAQASLVAVLEQEVARDPLIPPRLWELVRQLLAKAPRKRPDSASQVTAALYEATGNRDWTVRWEPQEVDKFQIQGRSVPRLPMPTPSSERRIESVPTFFDEEPPEAPTREPNSPWLTWPREHMFVTAIVLACSVVVTTALATSNSGAAGARDRLRSEKVAATFGIVQARRTGEAVAPEPSLHATSPALTKARAPLDAQHRLGKKPDF